MENYEDNRNDFKREIHLSAGTMILNRYCILELIDRGGFCYTYRARDTRLNIEVALKEFFPHGVASRVDGDTVTVFTHTDEMSFEKGKERFLREARGLAQFNQISGVVSVYDYFEYNSTAYIVMEFLKGQNLKRYTSGMQGNPDSAFIYDVARKMCDVLKIIHAHNVIHRDISPDNIFLCEDGTLKLIDFGALNQDYTGDNSTVTVILKQGYAPFEQYYDDGRQGPWTDIYALGATLYNLCTGRVPQQSVARFNQNNLIPPHELNPNITRNFSMAIMKAMSLRMEDRYQSAEEFEDALFDERERPDEYYSGEYAKVSGEAADASEERIGGQASFAVMDELEDSGETYALFSKKNRENEKEELDHEEGHGQDVDSRNKGNNTVRDEKSQIKEGKKHVGDEKVREDVRDSTLVQKNSSTNQSMVATVKKERVVITPNGKAVKVEYEEPVVDDKNDSVNNDKKIGTDRSTNQSTGATVKKERVVITPNGKAVKVDYEEALGESMNNKNNNITSVGNSIASSYNSKSDKRQSDYSEKKGSITDEIENDNVYVMHAQAKQSFWTKKKVAVCCVVGIVLAGLGIMVFSGSSSTNTDQQTARTTTQEARSTDKKTEVGTDVEEVDYPDVYDIKDGVFLINTSLFNQDYNTIKEKVESRGFRFDPDTPMQWFTDTNDYTAQWINPSDVVSVGFFFHKNKLVAIEYNDKVSTGISDNLVNTCAQNGEEYMREFNWSQYKSMSGKIEGVGFLFTTNEEDAGCYTIVNHDYSDDDGQHHEAKQIYNISEYFFYDSEAEVWNE